MSSSKKGFLNAGFSKTVNLVLCILIPLGVLCGLITRIMRKHYLCALLYLTAIVPFVCWVADILSIYDKNDITFGA